MVKGCTLSTSKLPRGGLPRNSVARIADRPDMTSAVYSGRKKIKQIKDKQKTMVMILNFRTDRSGQTVQTQIILLLEEQPDQGLHCLLFHLHVFDKIPSGLVSLFDF